MSSRILGIGVASPAYSIERDESVAFAQKLLYDAPKEARALPALYRMTAVQQRGSVLLEAANSTDTEGEPFYFDADSSDQRGPTTKVRSDRYAIESVPLGLRAAQEALRDANVSAASITHLIVVTCTGFSAPGIDIELIEQLGLNTETERVQVGFMGCHAAINGLRVARGIIAADPDSYVLLVSVELCTLHYQYGWDTDRVVSNAIFADGAAAVVLAGANDAASTLPQVAATGSKLVPDTKDSMTWRIGDHGFAMTLSAEVPGLIEEKLLDYVTDWLRRHQLTISDIKGWAVHPGGPRILRAVETALHLPEEALATSRAVLADHGNMSSATMLYILRRFLDHQVELPWIMLGFGPGLEIEIALIR